MSFYLILRGDLFLVRTDFIPTQEDQIMSDTTEQLEGGCLCGAVRFVAIGRPKAVYWCHCQSCRSHTGAPVAVFALFDCKAYRRYQRRDNQIRFYTRANAARLLRPMRIYLDLRKPPRADGNAFPYRCVRSGRTASADQKTILSRGAPAMVTPRRGIGAVIPADPTDRSAFAAIG